MKMPIEWHKENLKNQIIFLNNKIAELHALQNDINRIKEQVAFQEEQIKEAIKRNKDGFDAERFLKKKGKLK